MTSTMTTNEIVIKQYRSGCCAVRVCDPRIAGGINAEMQRVSIPLGDDKNAQRAAVDAVMEARGYVLARFDRDDYGNWLLAYAPAESMKVAA